MTFTAALGTCPTQVRNSEGPRGVMGPGGLDPSAAVGLKSTFPWKATSRKVTSSVCLQDQFSEWGWAVGVPEAFLRPPVVSLSTSEEAVRPEGSSRGGTKEPEQWTSPAALRQETEVPTAVAYRNIHGFAHGQALPGSTQLSPWLCSEWMLC